MKNKFSSVIDNIMIDKLADLKNGKEVPLSFVVFLREGYCVFEPAEMGLDKEVAIFFMRDMLKTIATEAYCILSDTNIRSPETMEIVGEQFMAMTVGKNGDISAFTRQYVRQNGKIEFVESLMKNNDMNYGGRMCELYQPNEKNLDEKLSPIMVAAHKAFVKENLKPYPGREHNRDDGMSIH